MTENDFVDDFKDVRTEFIERVALLFGIDLSKHELIKSVGPKCYVCWYCSVYTEDLYFSTEFDTPIHKECLLKQLQKDPKDPEMWIFLYEFF